MTISIINYGVSNLGSIQNMLKKIGIKAQIVSNKDEIINAKKLILPGVGSFDNGVTSLQKNNLFEAIITAANNDIPILGICLGMQLLGNSSEEGSLQGLGLIPGRTIKFSFRNNDLKIPHMGWNQIDPKKTNILIKNLDEESRFYFVHSYHFKPENEKYTLATTDYGINFNSIIYNNKIFGTQFHPEKSHKFGLKLLGNFANI